MSIRNFKIPLLVLAILLVASIVPIPLILLMYLNGGLFSLFSIHENNTFYLANAILGAVAISFVYKSTTSTATGIFVFLYIFFFLPFVRYVCDMLTNDSSFDAYSLYLDPFVITLPLLLVYVLKPRKKTLQSNSMRTTSDF